jgi:hypothetical protein
MSPDQQSFNDLKTQTSRTCSVSCRATDGAAEPDMFVVLLHVQAIYRGAS